MVCPEYGGDAIQSTNLSRYARAVVGAGESLGPAHLALLDYIADGSSVLDVGCSSGFLAARLAQRGCETVGIELHRADAAAARQHCQSVIEGDIEALDLRERLGSRTFDAIIFGDVLEHLRSPEPVLAKMRDFLRARGRVVVSIPNIAHASIRLQLLLGSFWYTPVGLLDETHLRFFTLETFEAMAHRAGFVVDGLTRIAEPVNPELLTEVAAQLQLDEATANRLAAYLSGPSAATLQYVMRLAPRGADGTSEAYPERPTWARSLTDYLAERDDLICRLQKDVAEQTAWALRLAHQIEERDKLIGQLQKQLAQQTDWAKRSAEQVAERDDIIRALQQELEEQTNWAQASAAQVRERDNIIRSLIADRPM